MQRIASEALLRRRGTSTRSFGAPMRMSGLLALSLFLAITAVDGINGVELLASTLLAVLVAVPDPGSK